MIRSVILFTVIVICTSGLQAQEYRTITGVGNNLTETTRGAVGDLLKRQPTPNYKDGFQEINDESLPTERQISNILFSQTEDLLEAKSLSDYVWLFGQFLDHDISLVATNEHSELSQLEIPNDDAFYDASTIIPLSRNEYVPGTGEGIGNPRQYSNEITSFIDASQVYGSSQERSDWLRTFSDGKLKVAKSTGGVSDLLPWNTLTGEFNSEIDYSSAAVMADDTRSLTKYFVAGDDRANENPLLIAIHTLFVREHNRLCDQIKADYPSLDDESIYQKARMFVGAYIQAITYYEWLPTLGINLPAYQGYNPDVDPAILNVFSAAAFRFGHTMIDDDIKRMDDQGNTIPAGDIKMRDAFFKPYDIVNANGLDPYFKGMGTQQMQEMDCKIIDDLRNFLFADSGLGLDLASINIFRGRDRGLPSYNALRADFGLTTVREFEDFSDNAEDVRSLTELYGDVNNIDAWVGMLAEPHLSDEAVFGELLTAIMKVQFRNLRDGDRFYFENDLAFTSEEIETIKGTTLHDIIMRNTGIELMQPNVFTAMPHMDIPNLVINEIPLEAVVFPNPVHFSTTVKIYSDAVVDMTYKVVNSQGALVSSGSMTLSEGQDNYLQLEFDGNLAKGVYNLLLESETAYKSIKLIKQ